MRRPGKLALHSAERKKAQSAGLAVGDQYVLGLKNTVHDGTVFRFGLFGRCAGRTLKAAAGTGTDLNGA